MASELWVADGAGLALVFVVCVARQLEFPGATVRMSVLPPLPAPKVSPATIMSWVPFWTMGVQLNVLLLGEPDSMRDDVPPGITTKTSTGGCASVL